MKDVLVLETKKQLELIGDPFVHDILDVMGNDVMKREDIIIEMNEKPEMINDYLNLMTENNILSVINEDGEEKLQTTAKSIDGSEAVYKFLKKENLDWLHGYINHLENRIVDFFRYLSQFDDMKDKLKELNYTTDIYASCTKVYLSSDEAEELISMISNYIKQDEEETKIKKGDDKYNLYEFYGYMFPELKKMKEKTK